MRALRAIHTARLAIRRVADVVNLDDYRETETPKQTTIEEFRRLIPEYFTSDDGGPSHTWARQMEREMWAQLQEHGIVEGSYDDAKATHYEE